MILERWHAVCGEPAAWSSIEAATLVAALLSAESGQAREQHTRWLEISDAARAWAATLPSLAVMNRQMSALRNVLAAEAADTAEMTRLSGLVDEALHAATEELAAQLEGAAMRDPLTGAGNRRWLDIAASSTLERAAGAREPVCLIALDLDGLKNVNDWHGHQAGDEAIGRLVAGLTAAARSGDQVFRTGGDEFVVLLPGSTVVGAREFIARLADFPTPAFTWGAADTTEESRTLDELLRAADQRLYAKRRAVRGAPAPGGAAAVFPGSPQALAALAPRSSRLQALSSRRRAIELAVSGALILAIGSIVASISSGNHSLCSAGDGTGPANCGLSNAVYYGGMVLILVGGLLLAGGIVSRVLLGRSELS